MVDSSPFWILPQLVPALGTEVLRPPDEMHNLEEIPSGVGGI